MIVMCILCAITTLYVPLFNRGKTKCCRNAKEKKQKPKIQKNSIKYQSFVKIKKVNNRLLPLQFRRQSQHSSHNRRLS